jgi:hypothetical protein
MQGFDISQFGHYGRHIGDWQGNAMSDLIDRQMSIHQLERALPFRCAKGCELVDMVVEFYYHSAIKGGYNCVSTKRGVQSTLLVSINQARVVAREAPLREERRLRYYYFTITPNTGRAPGFLCLLI